LSFSLALRTLPKAALATYAPSAPWNKAPTHSAMAALRERCGFSS